VKVARGKAWFLDAHGEENLERGAFVRSDMVRSARDKTLSSHGFPIPVGTSQGQLAGTCSGGGRRVEMALTRDDGRRSKVMLDEPAPGVGADDRAGTIFRIVRENS